MRVPRWHYCYVIFQVSMFLKSIFSLAQTEVHHSLRKFSRKFSTEFEVRNSFAASENFTRGRWKFHYLNSSDIFTCNKWKIHSRQVKISQPELKWHFHSQQVHRLPCTYCSEILSFRNKWNSHLSMCKWKIHLRQGKISLEPTLGEKSLVGLRVKFTEKKLEFHSL
jgi:hypothetical protein